MQTATPHKPVAFWLWDVSHGNISYSYKRVQVEQRLAKFITPACRDLHIVYLRLVVGYPLVYWPRVVVVEPLYDQPSLVPVVDVVVAVEDDHR